MKRTQRALQAMLAGALALLLAGIALGCSGSASDDGWEPVQDPETEAEAATGAEDETEATTEPDKARQTSGLKDEIPVPSIDLETVELQQLTDLLEYSEKDVEPLTLVALGEAGGSTEGAAETPVITVAAQGAIDLQAVGTQSVVYTLRADGQESERTLAFTVRDTRAPEISFTDSGPVVDHGATVDPTSYIEAVVDPVDGPLTHVEAEPSTLEGVPETADPGSMRFYDQGWYLLDGTVDAATPGTYAVTVLAADIHGNRTTKTLNIVVNEPPVEAAAAAAAPAEQQVHSYVINTNTGKFHHPYCNSVKQMKESNKWYYEGTREEVIAMGYVPCKNCNP